MFCVKDGDCRKDLSDPSARVARRGCLIGQVRRVRQVGRGGRAKSLVATLMRNPDDTDLYHAIVSNNCVPLSFRIID